LLVFKNGHYNFAQPLTSCGICQGCGAVAKMKQFHLRSSFIFGFHTPAHTLVFILILRVVLRHELEARRPQEKHSRRRKEEDLSSRVTDVVLVMRGE